MATSLVPAPTIGGSDAFGNSINIPYAGSLQQAQNTKVPTGGAMVIQSTPTVSSTTLGNSNKIDTANTLTSNLNTIATEQGVTSVNGAPQYANGTAVPQAPTPTETTPTVPSFVPEATYTDANGIQRLSSTGNAAPAPTGANYQNGFLMDSTGKKYQAPVGDTSGYDAQMNDIAAQTKARADAETASAIDNIQKQFSQLIADQTASNKGQEASVTNALLMGGVTGQGSSSQYAPISSSGIISSQVSYGLQKISALVDKENQLIQEAQAAGAQKNYPDLEKKMALIQNAKAATQAEAKALNDKLLAANQKAQDAKAQAARDNNIADLYTGGVHNPAELLSTLNANGGDYTLTEINAGLKNIASSVGTDVKNMTTDAKEFYTLKANGQIPQSILDLSTDSEQLNAYLRNKAIARKVPASSTKGTVVSGGLQYTPQDQAEDSKALESSRGGDGYVDPAKYEQLYKAWVSHGGLLKDFLAKFPPKNYVNPVNTTLPVVLRPAVKATSVGTRTP